MDKIAKLGAWLWLYKERLVLLVVVCVLCFRVYKVIVPDTIDLPKVAARPEPVPPDNPPQEIAPETEPAPYRAPLEQPRSALVRQNMFWYYADGGGQTAETEEKVDLELRGIITLPDGAPAARISSGGGRPKIYKEGEEFEQFKLESIDAENETVKVYAESLSRTITLAKNR